MKIFYYAMAVISLVLSIGLIIKGEPDTAIGTAAVGMSCSAMYEIKCLKEGD